MTCTRADHRPSRRLEASTSLHVFTVRCICSHNPGHGRGVCHAWFGGRAVQLEEGIHAQPWPASLRAAVRDLVRQRLPRSTDESIPRRSLARLWTVIPALERPFVKGWGWEPVAWRCGYATLSGLSQLFDREVGHGLRMASVRELGEQLGHLEHLLGLDGCQAAEHPGPAGLPAAPTSFSAGLGSTPLRAAEASDTHGRKGEETRLSQPQYLPVH